MRNINLWIEKLLELSKGNRLLNYKDIKAKSLDIILPSTRDLFDLLISEKSIDFKNVDALVAPMLNKNDKKEIVRKDVVESASYERIKCMSLDGSQVYFNSIFINKKEIHTDDINVLYTFLEGIRFCGVRTYSDQQIEGLYISILNDDENRAYIEYEVKITKSEIAASYQIEVNKNSLIFNVAKPDRSIDEFANIIDYTEYLISCLDEKYVAYKNDINICPIFLNEKESNRNVEDIIIDAFKDEKRIVAYKNGYKLTNILDNLKNVAHDSQKELGVNVLYVASGFIEYLDKSDNEWQKAPLILIPVIFDGSKVNKYQIKYNGNAIVTNPTLLYKLKHDYDIELNEFTLNPELNALDQFVGYLEEVKYLIEKQNFKLYERSVISIFTFYKMTMYNDLLKNYDKLVNQKSIKTLLNDKVGEVAKVKEFDASVESKIHNVLDADSSQMEAIYDAANGKSFVLQGPPGTGKSQTITNIIAQLLYHGKKVLFVSEKQAALDVVYRNLEKVGLSDYALNLHSHLANKNIVLDSIVRTMQDDKYVATKQASDDLNKLNDVKKDLDDVFNVLHQNIKGYDFSLFDAINMLSKLREKTTLNFSVEDNLINTKYYKESLDVINNYYNISNLEIYLHAFLNEFSKDSKNRILFKEKVSKLLLTFKDLDQFASKVKDVFSTNNNPTIKTLEAVTNLKEIYLGISNLNSKNIDTYNADYKNLQEKIEIKNQFLDKIKSAFNENIFLVNIDELIARLSSQNHKGLFKIFKKEYKDDRLDYARLLLNYDTNNLPSSDAMIENLADVKAMMISISKIDNLILDFKQKYHNKYEDINIDECNKNINEFCDKYSSVPCFEDVFDSNKFSELDNIYKTSKRAMKTILSNSFDKQLLELFTKELIDKELTVNSFYRKINELYENLGDIYSIDDIKNRDKKIKSLKLTNLLKDFTKNYDIDIDREILVNTFNLAFLNKLVEKTIYESDILYNYKEEEYLKKIDMYSELDVLKQYISRAQIIERLSFRVPKLDQDSRDPEISIILQELNKKRNQKSIRELIDAIPNTLEKVKPCFMMSPLSISSYLSNNNFKFDTVIFDEASQIFPWDALVAIYRANQVIIVGDSKQMSPSDFFIAGLNDDSSSYFKDAEDTLDYESILDIARTCFKEHTLRWHYRSRDESLIYFSNKNFYDNKLVTFPSNNLSKDMGVHFINIEDGVYSRRSRVNIKEAEAIVDMVFKHFKDKPNLSLGVVAFNIPQQDLISSLIQKRLQKQREYIKFFDRDIDEPFFIKNLENVQGDERDVIIFSIAYGRDMDGKFYHNFGPLNQQGGERRLNVAITRAKQSVYVVSSITSEDINLAKSDKVGVRLIKEYLDFAKNNNRDTYTYKNEKESYGIIEEVAKEIEKEGYKTYLSYGLSKLAIDLVVLNKNKFTLAIEIDSIKDPNINTTRERERLRSDILNSYGWKVFRLSALAWQKDRTKELLKILKAIEDKSPIKLKKNKFIKNPYIKVTPKDTNFKVLDDLFVDKKDIKQYLKLFNKFKPQDFKEILLKAQKENNFSSVLKVIIQNEGYIAVDDLQKRISKDFTSSKIDMKVLLNKLISSAPKNIQEVCGYVIDITKPVEFLAVDAKTGIKRDIEYISIDEIKHAIDTILEFNPTLEKDDIFSIIALLLGYDNLNSNMYNKFLVASSD